jgi:hypothetical protein
MAHIKIKAHFFALTLLFLTSLAFNLQAKQAVKSEYLIFNSNLPAISSNKFSISKVNDPDQLPADLKSFYIPSANYDYYFLIGPTQTSGGYLFEFDNFICLKKPAPMTAVTMGLSTPVALIKVKNDLNLKNKIGFCN